MSNIDRTVIVFDLDDTLYKERDYLKSGIGAVLQLLVDIKILSKGAAQSFDKDLYLSAGIIDRLCRKFNLDPKLKETLIWYYRLHLPQIKLEAETSRVIKWAQECAAGVAIITDGRSITQRLKLRALGLSHIMSFISEEHQNGKPDPEMFLKVEANWPNCKFAYVADNLEKDFIAPNQLKWKTIGLQDDGRNIVRPYALGKLQIPVEHKPTFWIDFMADLPELFQEE